MPVNLQIVVASPRLYVRLVDFAPQLLGLLGGDWLAQRFRALLFGCPPLTARTVSGHRLDSTGENKAKRIYLQWC
jgi:hypothetical protein